jgi:hypothetical protein
MPLNVNGTAMTLVNANGTRMSVVNVNGTEVYRAENGNVTFVGTGYSFNPGIEDANRHFVLVGGTFSGSALGGQPVPTVNGISCNSIQNNVGNGFGDGGIAGIFTVKIPTGTGTFSIGNVANYQFVIYRVTGIFSMASALTASAGGGTYSSSANGCFFGSSVQNFGNAPVPSPNSSGLAFSGVFGRDVSIAASNTTTGPTQSVSLGGNQVNAGATFAYDLF